MALPGARFACLRGHTDEKGIGMTKTTEPLILVSTGSEALEKEREDIAETLRFLADDLRQLRRKLHSGEPITAEDKKVLPDVRYWLRAAVETEAQIVEIKRKEAGLVGDYGLDLDVAREEIRCRMARLRPCCGSD